MLQPKSSLLIGDRIDKTADSWILASGQTGTFVQMSGDEVEKPTAGNMAFPIWTESNRDLTAGFTPDVTATGKVTIFYGKMYGITDQFVGTPSAQEALYVDANGKLTTTSAGAGIVVAICTKAAHDVKYLSKTFSAIEFVLV